MISLVWAVVALIAVVLAYRAAITLGGRKVATKQEVAEIAAKVENDTRRFATERAEVDKDVDRRLRSLLQLITDANDRIDAVDQRTDPTAQPQTSAQRTGRRL